MYFRSVRKLKALTVCPGEYDEYVYVGTQEGYLIKYRAKTLRVVNYVKLNEPVLEITNTRVRTIVKTKTKFMVLNFYLDYLEELEIPYHYMVSKDNNYYFCNGTSLQRYTQKLVLIDIVECEEKVVQLLKRSHCNVVAVTESGKIYEKGKLVGELDRRDKYLLDYCPEKGILTSRGYTIHHNGEMLKDVPPFLDACFGFKILKSGVVVKGTQHEKVTLYAEKLTYKGEVYWV